MWDTAGSLGMAIPFECCDLKMKLEMFIFVLCSQCTHQLANWALGTGH